MSRKLAEVIKVLFKAYGKNHDEELAEIYYQRLKHHDIGTIEKNVLRLLDRSVYLPKISEILKTPEEIISAQEQEFLRRFRSQATSPYAFTKIDNDVFTVKSYIGPSIVENAHLDQWHFIERKALKLFGLIRTKQIRFQNQLKIKETRHALCERG